MYGKHVEVKLNDEITVTVFVTCTPSTPEIELQKRALDILERLIGNKKFELLSGMKV